MDFIEKNYEKSLKENNIDNDLYQKYNVKKGLRNSNGTGVLIGLTKISEVHGYHMDHDQKIDDEGHLYYRGYDLFDLVEIDEDNFGYEKVCFLILFGRIPNDEEEKLFHDVLSKEYELPNDFLENVMLKNPSKNIMNHIQRAILSLYTFDDSNDDSDPFSTLKKGIALIAKMPAIISYAYQAKKHFIDKKSLVIHHPNPDLSLAESILYLCRADGKYSKEEADMLDSIMIVHADHGAGNNSTFANIVISSTGTDLYSCISGAIGSLKGPKHGGANKAVLEMMRTVINDIGTSPSDEELKEVIRRILNKDYYDNSGLIYGIGHAVYTKSDPRAIIIKNKCEELSKSCGYYDIFNFYKRFEENAILELKKAKGNDYNCCANVDFYSGLTYQMLGLPEELFTPIFATSRMIGWLAHNIENKLYCNKIIRPAGKYVGEIKKEI